MTDKNLKPTVIQEVPFPVGGQKSSDVSGNTNSPTQIGDKSFPTPIVANNMVSASLNTISRRVLSNFTFGQYGAIVVGKYVSGVSGDIRISPNGIVGRNSGGTTTFAIDGTTGNASFLGTIYATAGSIGGFTIQSGYLWAGSGASIAGLSPADYPFWAGASYANRATAPFRVTPAGAITAISGVIGGFTLGATSLFSPAVSPTIILDSAGSITVSNGNDKVMMTIDGGVGYVDFYADGSRRGRLRGTTAGSGGISCDTDFAITTNNKSFLMKGTGNDYATLGVDGDNLLIMTLTSAANKFKIVKSGNTHNYFIVDEGADILLNPPSGKKVSFGGNIYMNDHNIDDVQSIWSNDVELKGSGANTLKIGSYTLTLTANKTL